MLLSSDKYRLDLCWDSVEYQEGFCILHDAYFSGPVLDLAEEILPNTEIELDFYKQYFIVVNNVYIGKLKWKEVLYKNKKVHLSNCVLSHSSELNKAPKLKSSDMLVIDCKMHDRETHDFFTNYKTYVVNNDIQVYAYA